MNTQGTGNEAQTELDRLKPVLEEAKRLKTERDRYISGAMRDPAKSYSAQTRLKTPENISGIFNWCLEGLKWYREIGADPPEAVQAATAEYRQSSDKIGNFIADCLIKAEGKNCGAGAVYQRYSLWCEDNGFGCENKGNFFDELKSKGIFAASGTVDGKTVRNVVKGYVL